MAKITKKGTKMQKKGPNLPKRPKKAKWPEMTNTVLGHPVLSTVHG